LVIWET